MSKATKSDITFYAGSNKLLEGVPLKDCAGVRNGTGLLTSIKPFIIKVYSPDVDGTVTVEIPLLEFDYWKINILLEAIRFKLRLKTILGTYDMTVFNGQSLSDKQTTQLSLIPGISSDCLMTYTRFNESELSVPNVDAKFVKHSALRKYRNVFLPVRVDTEFARNLC